MDYNTNIYIKQIYISSGFGVNKLFKSFYLNEKNRFS
jgi:hypothetical protein